MKFYCTAENCQEQILFCPFPITVTGPSSLYKHTKFLHLTFGPFKSIPTHPCFAGPDSLSLPGYFLSPFSLSCLLFVHECFSHIPRGYSCIRLCHPSPSTLRIQLLLIVCHALYKEPFFEDKPHTEPGQDKGRHQLLPELVS